jgi:benzylsuccinate CoA-transferase BbsF subunit
VEGTAARDDLASVLETLHAELAKWTADFDDYALADRLQRHGVAAAPVLNVADLLRDPHYQARKTFIEIEHPLGFTETVYGNYVKTTRAEPAYAPGPAMGQDNEHVYRDLLGLSEARYRELVEAKIIY